MDPREKDKLDNMTENLEKTIVGLMQVIMDKNENKEGILKSMGEKITREESAWADQQAKVWMGGLQALVGQKDYLDKENWRVSGRPAQVVCEFLGAVADIQDPHGRIRGLLRAWVSEYLERALDEEDLQEVPPMLGEIYGKKFVFNINV